MTTYTYMTRGVCSRRMTVELEDGIIRDVRIEGGCSGNLQGISRLIVGMKAEDAIARMKGIQCGGKLREKKTTAQRPPDTRKHTVLPVSIRLKFTEKMPTCVSMRAFLQPISPRIYFGKTAAHLLRRMFSYARRPTRRLFYVSRGNSVHGQLSGGGQVTSTGLPVTGWAKAMRYDHSAVVQVALLP